MCQAQQTGPRCALIASKSLLVGLVTQFDWIDVITVFILIFFKKFGRSKSNNLSFDQNHQITNPILFCKYFGSLISHKNGFIFKICVWISIFRRKKLFENPILGCREIKQTRSLIFNEWKLVLGLQHVKVKVKVKVQTEKFRNIGDLP